MEDVVTIQGGDDSDIFAVFDGHNGQDAAVIADSQLPLIGREFFERRITMDFLTRYTRRSSRRQNLGQLQQSLTSRKNGSLFFNAEIQLHLFLKTENYGKSQRTTTPHRLKRQQT